MKSLKKLAGLLKPPAKSLYSPDVRSDSRLESIIKNTLPKSFYDFLGIYGAGYICTESSELDFLRIYTPAVMLKQNKTFYDALRGKDSDIFSNVPWDEPEGWLMWGGSCDGHQYYWRMKGVPNSWSIIVEDRYSLERDEYRLDLAAFLADALSSTIRPEGFSDSLRDPAARPLWKQYEPKKA
jgi:hypothetical protein